MSDGFGPPDGEPTLREIEQEDATRVAANLDRCRQENEKLRIEIEEFRFDLKRVIDWMDREAGTTPAKHPGESPRAELARTIAVELRVLLEPDRCGDV